MIKCLSLIDTMRDVYECNSILKLQKDRKKSIVYNYKVGNKNIRRNFYH